MRRRTDVIKMDDAADVAGEIMCTCDIPFTGMNLTCDTCHPRKAAKRVKKKTPKPFLYKATAKFKGGKRVESEPTTQQNARSIANLCVAQGATFAAILRDDRGIHHPDNDGKFFLHQYIKA